MFYITLHFIVFIDIDLLHYVASFVLMLKCCELSPYDIQIVMIVRLK